MYKRQDTNNYYQLTHNTATDRSPTWSPDGQQIAFVSNMDGQWDIYIMDSNEDRIQRLTNSVSEEKVPSWSPNGQLIAFATQNTPDTNFSIHVMKIDLSLIHI